MATYLEHRVQRAIDDLVEARANYAAQAYAERDQSDAARDQSNPSPAPAVTLDMECDLDVANMRYKSRQSYDMDLYSRADKSRR